jgi:hypothetical protein
MAIPLSQSSSNQGPILRLCFSSARNQTQLPEFIASLCALDYAVTSAEILTSTTLSLKSFYVCFKPYLSILCPCDLP